MKTALDGGEWSASCSSRFTPTGKLPVPTGQEAGWAPEPVLKRWRREKFRYPAGNRWPVIHSLYWL